MANLPNDSALVDPSVTQAGFKTALRTLLAYLRSGIGPTGDPQSIRSALGLNGVPLVFNNRGAWATATAYAQNDTVTSGGVVYLAMQGHTAGTFATDLAGGLWMVWQGVTLQQLQGTGAGQGAQLVWFVQALAGAVAVSAASKFGETLSTADFGIVGNGIADDTTALGNAVAALGPGVVLNLRGKTILVSSNTYISNKSGFIIDGQGATIIAQNGMAVSSGKELLSFRSCSDFKVCNLTVDGNRANRTPAETAAHNLEFRTCVRFVAERLRSINSCVDGFILNTGTNNVASTYCRDFALIECTADNSYRQGASIINAYNGVILGGAYTNTAGTAPQAGIDIESNTGAAVPGNAWILVKGARFAGNAGRGILASGVSSTAEIWITENQFENNTLGGVDANANSCWVERNVFRSHGTGVVNGIVTFSAATAIKSGAAVGNTFTSNTSTVACIHVHSTASNIRIERNNILDHTTAGGINASGTDTQISHNYVNASGGVGINIVATDPFVFGNVITNALGRAILSVGSLRPTIMQNTCRDVAAVSGAYIQVDDAESVVDRNTCISASAATTTFGVRITNVTARSVSFNNFVNLHSTDPITFTGVGRARAYIGNTGGTVNVGGMIEGENMRATQASVGKASTTTIGGTTATTVGAAGAATALPANPLGYIIGHVGTTQVKIPYYNP